MSGSDAASHPPLPLALTLGEPAGIGGEIALMAWARRGEGVPAFFAMDAPDRLATLARRVGLAVPVIAIDRPAEAGRAFGTGLPVLPHPVPRPPAPGRIERANAPAVIDSIRRAVALVQAGEAAAVVTNPVHKRSLYEAGFPHPGQTEFLGALAGNAGDAVMMLVGSGLRVVPVSVHIALARAVARLSTESIVHAGLTAARALRSDFGIARPRLAVAGLNPHAGEEGTLGREDIEIVAPAVAALRAEGIEVRGPLSADTMFHPRARATYDAALCMYHDQALIPLKTIAFDEGVNVTIGLPFIRTSPDHGTALDIAGRGVARPDSLIAALRVAAEMAACRARSRQGIAA